MKRKWVEVLEGAKAALKVAEEEAKQLRCVRVERRLVDHGAFDLMDPFQCLLDRGHEGECAFTEKALSEYEKETA